MKSTASLKLGIWTALLIAAIVLAGGAFVAFGWIENGSAPSSEATPMQSSLHSAAEDGRSEAKGLSVESPNVVGMSAEDRTRINPMDELPEVFAYAPDNPYRCDSPKGAMPTCAWQSDPMVARSPREAEWMRNQGYPTVDERHWAQSRSAAAVLSEAERTESTALWAMGLERTAIDSSVAEDAAEAALNLSRLASNNKSLYALERSATLQAHVIELVITEHGLAPADGDSDSLISQALSSAKNAGIQAALLGDGRAMLRIEHALRDVPGLAQSERWKTFETIRFWEIGSEIKHLQSAMQRNAYDQSIGLGGPYGGFTLADIKPRPVQTSVIGDGRPGGVWVER